MVQKITSWSYSRLAAYKECPFKAKCKFIDKLPEPPSPAMDRGNKIHKLAENYTKGIITKLPTELKLFKNQFKLLKASDPMVEETWAFTNKWQETRWNDWNNCWVRIKTDAAFLDEETLTVIDHKTGKKRDSYGEQLSLYGLGGMLKFPHIKEVKTQLWFLDSGETEECTYKASEMKKLLASWNDKVKKMLTDSKFKPTPNNNCRFCPFRSSEGGPCKH